MKFTKFLSAFLSLFFILIGMEKVFGMESVSEPEKCRMCGKNGCKFTVVESWFAVAPERVCSWDCGLKYINQCKKKFKKVHQMWFK